VSGEPLFLDLWEGDQDGLGASDRRALALAGSILALELTRRRADDAGPR
jgi:hypothetical protein